MSTTHQALRFISAGAVGVLLYFFILYALTDWLDVWYLASAIVASVVNWASNFILHKHWTFESHGLRNVRRQMGFYGLLMAALFFLNTALLYVLVEYAHLWYLGAQVIVTVVLTVISFVVSRVIFAE